MKSAHKSTQKSRSLGWLEQIYFEKGADAAKADFEREFPVAIESLYSLRRIGEGQSVIRTDTDAKDGIEYDSYSPPAFWEIPYQIMRVRLEKVNQREYLFHSGEELVVPTSGSIRYHFFWCDPSSGNTPPKKELTNTLRPATLIRVNA